MREAHHLRFRSQIHCFIQIPRKQNDIDVVEQVSKIVFMCIYVTKRAHTHNAAVLMLANLGECLEIICEIFCCSQK